VTVLPDIPTFVSVNLRNRKGPLTLTFVQKEKSDLLVYLSTVVKDPDEKTHQQKKLNPTKMVVSSGEYDPQFRDKKLYATLKSDRGA
jgi:hypothetical protein